MMKDKQTELEFENKRLSETIALAEHKISQARCVNENNKEAIIAAKKEIRENTSHSISSLWSSEGFEALAELSQEINPVVNKIIDYEEVEKKITQLEILKESPYFARIDFKFEDEDIFEKIYIGRSSLKNDETREICVYDWRSPIASVFYRFVLGNAFYDAPGGRITGEINLKRQYEIKHGKLNYFFDTDIQIIDEFLRQLLSQNTSPKMKAIVETIQTDQDIVIRDMENDLMMVQGVAGSGKTSVALHRAAYLMYQGLERKLSANNIMIISPNSLFEKYISDVLPELGETNISSVIFDEILSDLLPGRHLQSRNQYLEIMLNSSNHNRQIMENSIRFKTSRQFLEILSRFIEENAVSLQEIRKCTASGVIELYEALPVTEESFSHLIEDLNLTCSIGDIWEFTRDNLNSGCLYYDDAIVLAYFHLKIYGTEKFKNIKQIVIDEAQDYYPLQYEIFHLLFPNSRFTVLGDIMQTLEKQENLSFYGQIADILKKKKSSLITMNKSFRCTSEILNYSLKFIDQQPEIKSFNRNGDEPEIHTADDQKEFYNLITSEIEYCTRKGYQSIGLIFKTVKNARDVCKNLNAAMDIQLIENESTSDLHGVSAVPVYLSKGLEFDAVLICDADASNYFSPSDKNLLYIACTRALHRLGLFCKGTPSLLL